MSFEFNYEINGRKVSQEEWMRHISKDAIGQAAQEQKRKIEAMQCPVHGESPRVQMTQGADGVKLSITACCQEMAESAQRVGAGG